MASFWCDNAAFVLMGGGLDLDSNTLRFLIAMTNTTCDTERDKTTVSGYSTLDEADGANYVRKTLASLALTNDTVNHRTYLSAANVTWTALGAGTRQYAGILMYKFVTNDADSIPLAWIDSGGFPFAGNGSDVTFQVNAAGILRAQA